MNVPITKERGRSPKRIPSGCNSECLIVPTISIQHMESLPVLQLEDEKFDGKIGGVYRGDVR